MNKKKIYWIANIVKFGKTFYVRVDKGVIDFLRLSNGDQIIVNINPGDIMRKSKRTASRLEGIDEPVKEGQTHRGDLNVKVE